MSGISGIYSLDESFFPELTRSLYSGLVTTSDRGEASTGAAIVDPLGEIDLYTGPGRADVAIPQKIIKKHSFCAIGHNRYARELDHEEMNNRQPVKLTTSDVYDRYECYISADSVFIPSFLDSLAKELEEEGYKFSTLTGAERIGALFLNHLKKTNNIIESCEYTIHKLHGGGGYSSSILLKDTTKGLDGINLIALRDAYGVKPFCFGEKDGTHYLNSETYWLEKEGVDKIEDVKRGGGIIISKDGIKQFQSIDLGQAQWRLCNFDPIYFGSAFARLMFPLGPKFYELVKKLKEVSPEFYDKPTNNTTRECIGVSFPEFYPDVKDLVELFVSSPNSGNGMTGGLGIGYNKPALLNAVKKSSAVGKTFLTRDESWRKVIEVYVKFEVNRDVLKGKRIGIGEDSIVRGSVTKGDGHVSRRGGLIDQLNYVAQVAFMMVLSSYPPYAFNCVKYFGREEALAAQCLHKNDVRESNEIVGKKMGVPVRYNPLQNLYGIYGPHFCRGCADGKFPFINYQIIPDKTKRILEEAGVY